MHFFREFRPEFNDDLGTTPTRRPYSWKKKEWRRIVEWFSHARHLQDMEAVIAERTWSGIDTFYTKMDQTNPIKAAQAEPEQASSPVEQTMAEASTSPSLCPDDKAEEE